MTVATGTKVTDKKTFVAAVLAMIAGVTKDLTAKMPVAKNPISMRKNSISVRGELVIFDGE